MNRSDIAILAIRLAAVYAWLQALDYIAGGAMSFFLTQSKVFGGSSPFALLVCVLPCLLFFAAGLFLWLRAPALAQRLIASSAPGPSNASGASLSFAIVGLAVFLHALPNVISASITFLRSQQGNGGDASQDFLLHLPSLSASAVQLICGFALFVRPHRLVRWWERRRDSNVSI